MAGGYAGKVLRVNLTTRSVSTIDSKPYTDKYGGAHGVGSAIFWDLAASTDWDMLDGFDERNVVTVMTGPLSGTIVSCSSRSEVQGVAPQKWPVEWFSRSGFGGRFGAMMKWAGWDGIAIEGKASSPVWINVINDNVTIEDAGPEGDNIWGMSTWQAQQEIWRKIRGTRRFGEWFNVGNFESTTEQPAILSCGPVGEAQSRLGSLVHDGGSGAGQGGYGGVFGSKNLKSISFLGTGGVDVDDPAGLVDTRIWYKKNYAYNVDNPVRAGEWRAPTHGANSMNFTNQRRGSGCVGTSFNCRQQTYTGSSNDSQCSDVWFSHSDKSLRARATDWTQQYAINVRELENYLRDLHEMGELGQGKAIESAPLNMDNYGKVSFAEELFRSIADREGIGNDIAEGEVRFSNLIGRYEDDSGPNRLLNTPHWGDRWHHAALPYWLHTSLFGSRDVNNHCVQYSSGHVAQRRLGTTWEITAEELANEMAESNPGPFNGEPLVYSNTWQGNDGEYMEDALETGWYSPYQAKNIAWHARYDSSWQQGMGNCCWNWGIAFGNYHCMQNPDFQGGTAGGADIRFYNNVTGKDNTFAEVMKIGQRVWNLDRAIWVLQGRHRDIEHYTASRQYEYPGTAWANRAMPMYRNGAWEFDNYTAGNAPFSDRDGTEALKTHYYELEGWDTTTGAPTRATLEELDLGFVADKLEAAGKI